MSSCVILGWLSSVREDVFPISFMPGYIWLFFFSSFQGGFSSLCGHVTLFLCFQCPELGNLRSSSSVPSWVTAWITHAWFMSCVFLVKGTLQNDSSCGLSVIGCLLQKSLQAPSSFGRSSKLSYIIIIDTCFIFKLIRCFCHTVYHKLIYPDNSLGVTARCWPFHRGGSWDTGRWTWNLTPPERTPGNFETVQEGLPL